MFRRHSRESPYLSTFLKTAEHIAEAQRALLEAIPTSRRVGVPLDHALARFERLLRAAAETIREWPETMTTRSRAAEAVDAARASAGELKGRPALEFEELNARVGDVLHPLEEFAEIERAIRRGTL